MKLHSAIFLVAIAWATFLRPAYANLVVEQHLLVPLASQFSVRLLRLNLQNPRLQMRPRWASPNQVTGTAPLAQIAQTHGAIAGINGGFFHVQRQMPLGAIKTDQQWYGGAILGRGAIAWNDQGQILIDRLVYGERLTINQSLIFLQALNSGYVKAGIARYDSNWGEFYTPLTQAEQIFVVQSDRLTSQVSGESAIPIPRDGYLLVARQADPKDLAKLQLNAPVSLDSRTMPQQFSVFPQVLGAGPLLLKQGQIVLDPKREGFSPGFSTTKAARSAIATTSQPGEILLVTIPTQANSTLPNLEQTAQILQKLGAVDALNLDGGGSSGLFNSNDINSKRPVHNALLIFLSQ
ncbi:MAG: phosphodiester glycosidase family protein [Pseudanabaenaceae cyanobacterium bins.68]|nr:phosphodiester glycosidase family protein [Pseudanabaenaceae cyanobacterium bins.68]